MCKSNRSVWDIDIEFVELKYLDDKKEKPYLLYVSHDEKEYFYKELDKYEYDYQLEEFKNIKAIQKKQRAILFNVYYEYYYLPQGSTEDKENKKKYFFYKYN